MTANGNATSTSVAGSARGTTIATNGADSRFNPNPIDPWTIAPTDTAVAATTNAPTPTCTAGDPDRPAP